MFPKKIDQEYVNELLLKVEGEQLEFKQQISSQEKIAKTLAAFANSKGGVLLVGVSDQRKIVGIDPEEERYMVAAANDIFCIPKVSMELRTIKIDPKHPNEEEKMILLVHVHASLGPQVFVKQKNGTSKTYSRIGSQNKIVKI